MIGTTLVQYKVTAALGEGGMGQVWRAEDEKLGREVALKVLPEEFAKDPESMARFQREAKVLASLNHPNIATLYGLESVSGTDADAGETTFLAMELVEGEDLSERINRAQCRSKRRSRFHFKSPRRSRRRTSRASFTVISSLPTSSCVPMARSRCSISGSPKPGSQNMATRAFLCPRR